MSRVVRACAGRSALALVAGLVSLLSVGGARAQPVLLHPAAQTDSPKDLTGNGGGGGGGSPPVRTSGCEYRVDDGTVNNAIGAGVGSIAWLNKFQASVGCGYIRKVEVAWGYPGSTITDGSTAKICIWDDPDEDGNPSNAVLVYSEDVIVSSAATGQLVPYQLAVPVKVTGIYFAGAAFAVGNTYPAAWDNSSYVNGTSWVAGGPVLNLNNLSASSFFGSNESFGLSGYYLVRAHAGAGPFTYQGVLQDGGAPANGSADFKFTIFESLTGGSAASPTIDRTSVPVTDGRFMTSLVVDPPILDGRPLFLEIQARFPAGAGAYQTLTPRQPMTPTLLAEHAENSERSTTADQAAEALTVTGEVPWAQISGKPAIPDGSSLDASDGLPANAVQVDASGNVGINTLTPLGRLHVVDAAGGTGTVRLPGSAIDASEVFDEPGVANVLSSGTIPSTGVVTRIGTCVISVPAPGYVVAISTFESSFIHTTGTTDNYIVGVSNQPTAFPASGWQDVEHFVNSALPTGQIDTPITVHGLFRVDTAGDHTFYTLGQKSVGAAVTCNDVNLTLIYLPTAYGAVSSNFRSGEGGDRDPPPPGASAGSRGRQDPAPASQDLAKVLRELDELREKVRVLEARLAAQDGSRR